MSHELKRIETSKIDVDPAIRARTIITPKMVRKHVDYIESGVQLPPLVAAKAINGRVTLMDGLIRLMAYKEVGQKFVDVEVRDGSAHDILVETVELQANTPVPLTNHEKRRAIWLLLEDPECFQWSDSRIAAHTGTSGPTAGKVRRQFKEEKGIAEEGRRVAKNGTPVGLKRNRLDGDGSLKLGAAGVVEWLKKSGVRMSKCQDTPAGMTDIILPGGAVAKVQARAEEHSLLYAAAAVLIQNLSVKTATRSLVVCNVESKAAQSLKDSLGRIGVELVSPTGLAAEFGPRAKKLKVV